MSDDNKKLSGLQVLRGMAAVSVLCFHLVAVLPASGSLSVLANLFSWGFAGVDVFFVISGYVMWYSTEQIAGSAAARKFMIQRLLRIYLGYWPFLALAYWAEATYTPSALSSKNWIGSLFLLDVDLNRQVLVIAWSLVFEQYFYFLFALLLLIAPTRRRIAIIFITVGLIATNLLIFNGLMNGSPFSSWQQWGFFYCPFVVEFFVGATIATVVRDAVRNDVRRTASLVVAGGLVLVGVLSGVGNEAARNDVWVRSATFGMMAVGLVAFMAIANGLVIKWPQALTRIGDCSYTLYLFHALALAQAIRWGIFNPAAYSPERELAVVAIGAVVIIGMAYALFRLIELPLYRFGLRRLLGDHRTAAGNVKCETA